MSPDSVAAAQTFLTKLMSERAASLGVALDWNSFRCLSRKKWRGGDLIITQWARVLR